MTYRTHTRTQYTQTHIAGTTTYLREADAVDVLGVGELWVLANVLGKHIDVLVHRHQKAVRGVSEDVARGNALGIPMAAVFKYLPFVCLQACNQQLVHITHVMDKCDTSTTNNISTRQPTANETTTNDQRQTTNDRQTTNARSRCLGDHVRDLLHPFVETRIAHAVRRHRRVWIGSVDNSRRRRCCCCGGEEHLGGHFLVCVATLRENDDLLLWTTMASDDTDEARNLESQRKARREETDWFTTASKSLINVLDEQVAVGNRPRPVHAPALVRAKTRKAHTHAKHARKANTHTRARARAHTHTHTH